VIDNIDSINSHGHAFSHGEAFDHGKADWSQIPWS
jgi:hypothetical protein